MAFGFATSSRSDFVHHMHIMAPRLRCRKGKSGLEDRQIVHLGQGTLRPMKSSNASMEKWVRELRPGVPKSNTESIGIHRPCSLAKDRKWRKSSTLPHRRLTLKRAADRLPSSMLKSAGRFIFLWHIIQRPAPPTTAFRSCRGLFRGTFCRSALPFALARTSQLFDD